MTNDPNDFDLVHAGEDDIPMMAALWAEAFPEKPAERRDRELREGFVYGDLTDCWTVRIDGRLAGALRTYRLQSWFRGRLLPTMGLAGVAVAPDFRRRGIGRRMCVEAIRIAKERGDVLCGLYPFRASFYRDLGFSLVGELHRYRFDPTTLSAYPGWDRVVRAPENGAEVARAIYDRVAPNTNGLIARSDRMWDFLDRVGTYLYIHHDHRDRPTGYIVVRGRGGPPEQSYLRVQELVAEDRAAYLALLGWLSVQKDQWGRVVYDALPGESFQHRLMHPRTEGTGTPRGLWFHSASILRGPMFRILDLAALLEADEGHARIVQPDQDGVLPDGSLQIRDPILGDNQGIWKDGERVEESLRPTRSSVLSIEDAMARISQGRLHGLPVEPEGWSPNLGLADPRILDEY